MKAARLDDALIAELRKLAPGSSGKLAALKAAIGCGQADLQAAIRRLRYQGKIKFDRLELAPSQREAVHVEHLARPTADAPGGEEAQPPSTGSDPADGDHKRALPPNPSGAELEGEVRDYCRAHGASLSDFSRAAVGYAGLLANLKHYAPRPATVAKVRGFIAAHPDGLPAAQDKAAPEPPDVKHYMADRAAPAPPIRDQVAAEAAEAVGRRAIARIVGGSGTPLSPALRPAVEAIQSEAAATPEDLLRAVMRRHKPLWQRTVQVSRARGITPASALYSALEAGLDHFEGETASVQR